MNPPYEKLEVWQVSDALAQRIYEVTARFPGNEKYGLTSQIRRAAVAVPANIVEGNARHHLREYIQFCHVARSSAMELRYLLQFSAKVGILRQQEYEELADGYDRVGAMLHALTTKLSRGLV